MENEALVLTVSFGSAPVRISRPKRRAGSVEILLRQIEACWINGSSRKPIPGLRTPSSKSAAGILPFIHLSELYIDELVENGNPKVIIFNCDGENTNLAALKVLVRSLSVYAKIIVYANICTGHVVNNSSKCPTGL